MAISAAGRGDWWPACRIRAVPPELLEQCAALCLLSLHSNPITEDQLQGTQGFQLYEERRQRHANKQVPAALPERCCHPRDPAYICAQLLCALRVVSMQLLTLTA